MTFLIQEDNFHKIIFDWLELLSFVIVCLKYPDKTRKQLFNSNVEPPPHPFYFSLNKNKQYFVINYLTVIKIYPQTCLFSKFERKTTWLHFSKPEMFSCLSVYF